MRTKYLIAAVTAVFLTGGLWVGRAVWRAYRQVVTLQVHNEPLAGVLRKIERQTWRKIRAETNLQARITLNVVDEPLSRVMDRLSEQAGARWSTLYAVYGSTRALTALESALATDGKLERVGWRKVAPTAAESDQDHAPGRQMMRLPSGVGPGSPEGEPGLMAQVAHPPDQATPDGAVPKAARRPGRMMFWRRNTGATVIQNDAGEVEEWSPEELVMESTLTSRLNSSSSPDATAASAAEVARKLDTHWAMVLALRKSIAGVGMGMVPGPGSDPLKRGPNDRFVRLTPEQRAQRAREQRGF